MLGVVLVTCSMSAGRLFVPDDLKVSTYTST